MSATRVLILCVLSIALGAPTSFGDATSDVTGTSSWLPQNGFSGSGAGLTANVGMCFGAGSNPFAQLAQQIQQIKSKNKGKTSGPGACKNPVVPNSDNLKCDAFMNDSGTFNDQQFKATLAKVKGDVDGFAYEQSQFSSVQQELQCVKQQSNLLASQLAQLKSVYQQNIQRFQSDLQQYKMRVADRESQMQQVAKLLGGDQSTGKEGLVQLQQEMQGLVNQGIPTEQQTLANGGASGFGGNATVPGTVQIAQQNQMVQEEINQRQLALMNQCFAQTPYVDPNGHALFCPGGSNPVSAEQYIVCTYGAGQNIVGNNYDTNAITQGIGQQNTTSVNTLFSLLSSSSPQDPLFPTTPQLQAKNLSNTFSIFTMTDIQNQITSRLPTSALGNTGYTVQGFTNAVLGACYTQAQYTVENEENEASSAIGFALNQLKTAQSQNQTEFTKALQSYSQAWSKVMSTMSSQYAPMDVSQCQNATPAVETNCLNNIQTDMQGILTGTGPTGKGSYLMQVTGKFPCRSANDPTCTQIPPADLTCHSLSNCVQLLQQLQPQLQTAHDNLVNQQQQYVTQAKQSTQQFTNQLVQLLNQQVNGPMGGVGGQGMQGKIDNLNQTLECLGVSPINFTGIQGQPMQYDQNDGLPETPDNMVAFLGSQLTPPMPDLTSGNVDYSSLQQAKSTVDQNAQDAQNAYEKLKGMEQSCIEHATDKKANRLILTSNFAGACSTTNGQNLQACFNSVTLGDGTAEQGTTLVRNVIGLLGSVSGDSAGDDEVSNTLSGYLQGCQGASTKVQNAIDKVRSCSTCGASPTSANCAADDNSKAGSCTTDAGPGTCCQAYNTLMGLISNSTVTMPTLLQSGTQALAQSSGEGACQQAFNRLNKAEQLLGNMNNGQSQAGQL